MKRLIICGAIGLMTGTAGVSAQDAKLEIWQRSGEKIVLDLSESLKTTFANDSLLVTSETFSVGYPLKDIQRYTYVLPTLGIKPQQGRQAVRITREGNVFTFHQLKPGSRVDIYALDGRLLKTLSVGQGQKLTVSLKDNAKGIYVVKIGNTSYKIQKQ